MKAGEPDQAVDQQDGRYGQQGADEQRPGHDAKARQDGGGDAARRDRERSGDHHHGTAEEADDGHDPDLHEFAEDGDADLYFDDRNRA